METVNFQCGHCGNLMGVGHEFLGQQVRCPHCQQVVLAPPPPAPAPPPAPEGLQPPRLNLPDLSEPDSIFSSSDADDSLFGGSPRPLVELPPVEPTASAAPPVPQVETTEPYAPPETAADGAPPAFAPDPLPPLPEPMSPAQEPLAPAGEPNLLEQAIPRPVVRAPRQSGGWLIALVIVPLISYSILATIAVLYLRFFQPPPPQPPHPLEMVPDLEGDNKGATRSGKRVSINFQGRQLRELPPNLVTSLGQSLTVGDLEVMPERVERRKITFRVPGYEKPEPSADDCLLLHLRLKNVSRDVVFKPLDPFFYRKWRQEKGKTDVDMPFSYLTIGERRFFGGPLEYRPRGPKGGRDDPMHTIDGQDLNIELKPGEAMRTFVCTDPDDAGVKKALAAAHGPMTWRLHVRRGLVEIPNKGEYSACAVVGVTFTDQDIGRPAAE